MSTGGILLPSEGWGLAALPDALHLERDASGQELASLPPGGYPCRRLESLFERLAPGLAPPPPSAIPTAFYRVAATKEGYAYIADRDFEVLELPLGDFRLPPRCLRPFLRERGLAALRFSAGGLDILLDLEEAWARLFNANSQP